MKQQLQRMLPSSITFLSLSVVLVSTWMLSDWHKDVTTNSLGGRRQLEFNDSPIDISDDDAQHDDICRKYLLNFLNGTTDERDECDGMKNAYTAADCEDKKTRRRGLKHHHHNGTDDDVLIDDQFEAWQCCSSIYKYYSQNCQRPELPSTKLLGVVIVFILCGLAMSLVRTFSIEWIPDAAVCILVGATVGGFVQVVYPSMMQNNLSFDNDLFLHILLPPIIFQAALSIDKQAFRRDLFPILCFAVGGTVLSAIAIGVMTYYLSSLGHGTSLPLLDSLLFGSLISSIDPVATLGILSGVGVSQTDTLYTLIFGESLLNDGVAIVLFDTMVTHLGDYKEEELPNYDAHTNIYANVTLDMYSNVDKEMAHEIIIAFLKCTSASIGIGLGCGALCTIYFWALRHKHTAVVETAIFFCFALMPFYIADGMEFSGIIAIMTMGFITDFFVIGGSQSDEVQWMAHVEHQNEQYHRHHGDDEKRWFHCYKAFSGIGHLSSRSKHHVGFVAEVISQLMEMAIFAYLGLFLFNDSSILNFRLNSIGVLGCIVSRGVIIVLFSLVINFFVWLDLERRIFGCCRSIRQQPISFEDDDDDDSIGSTLRIYLDRRTQTFLLLAGVRGAVSFALVENIPVYDTVRKTGSHYKAELKAMTSTSILFTVFVFGALTYFLVKKEQEHSDENGNRRALTQRLLSSGLDSQMDDESSDERSRYSELPSDLELTISPPRSPPKSPPPPPPLE
mmetsp:Transcript_28220/g.41689  ORF Transcript_28220/g.41689 Transcript_28220/m.41689 type:complete len:732 (-) Transcript_28220:551-2746(-)|eukprot:CAMPEP_0194231036 /NCGR_PEP_ID=MMETSP0156-20130528/44718_1 /TAXON_ID=33649 /ORGANISM="Thalassionema nitzschioides, Strain L26-B" /LENGTH=731 /DNA_ID=CAMNT_0038963641 /DNA_START=118 /DNA_END=2313 /DNA_ORIENTATION=-